MVDPQRLRVPRVGKVCVGKVCTIRVRVEETKENPSPSCATSFFCCNASLKLLLHNVAYRIRRVDRTISRSVFQPLSTIEYMIGERNEGGQEPMWLLADRHDV